jgi:hypothetical protein
LLSRDDQTEYRRCADQRAYIKREDLSEDNYMISILGVGGGGVGVGQGEIKPNRKKLFKHNTARQSDLSRVCGIQ